MEFHRGAWRVHGILSVSRSIGDSHLKKWVVAEPETKILHFDTNMEFLVLASDGLWEKVKNHKNSFFFVDLLVNELVYLLSSNPFYTSALHVCSNELLYFQVNGQAIKPFFFF